MLYTPKIYTVESVTSGHPDKICDQISDAILDECLAKDPFSRVAVETFGSHGHLFIGGEITSKGKINFEKIAKQVYKEIGHEEPIEVTTQIVKQSPDIAQGVNTGGAGDQGIMYGYATNETPEFLPLGVVLAHKLTKGLEKLRTSKKLPWLKPDGKSQVTLEGNKVKTVLVSCQHSPDTTQEMIDIGIIEKLIKPIFGSVEDIEILINPTGKFTIGGFSADTGLTGRKLMVDTYGGLVPHGGGCFSGKDPSKVDRSAAYMARFVAKNIVANKKAKRCLVSVSYAIGRAKPLMIEAVNEDGKDITKYTEKFDFTPEGIIKTLKLRRPIYRQTASYGHFSNPKLPWEKIIKL